MSAHSNYVELFDDRPSTCEGLATLIKSHGLDVREERSGRRFARTIKLLESMSRNEAEKAAPAGYVVDNHIEGMSTLVDFGRQDIPTDDGANAGWRVTTEILLPKMTLGKIPVRPIAMLSGQPLEGVEAEYYSRFGGSNSSRVYFLNKNESMNDNDAATSFVKALYRGRLEFVGETPSMEAIFKMFEISVNRLDLSSSEIGLLYRFNTNMMNDPLARRLEASTTNDWQIKTQLLFRIVSALSDIFAQAKDKAARDQEIRKYVKKPEPALHNQTIRSLIVSGSESALEDVLDFLLNPADFE